MSGAANNLPLVPGTWRSGSESNVNNTWSRSSPGTPPLSYAPPSFREGRTGGAYTYVPSTQGNWRSGTDSGVDNHTSTWNRPSQVPRGYPSRPVATSGGTPNPWTLFEDRVRTGPYGLNSFPSHPFSPLRIVVLDNETPQEVNPRLRQFIQESPPRIRGQWQTQLVPEEDESRLTQEEQRKALKKLKKQVYNPKSRNMRMSLYYRDKSPNSYNNKDEDGKSCAICLEDFLPKEEVLVTPCNHMFHDECIVPWVKSNGQCPVCRFSLGRRSERRALATFPLNNNNGNLPDDVTGMDLISLIRAMEEAFEWVNFRR